MNMLEIQEKVQNEPCIRSMYLTVWGHGLYVKCVFENRDNGTDVFLSGEKVKGLIAGGELAGAEGIASWTQGMGEGFFAQPRSGCSWWDVGYTHGIITIEPDMMDLDDIIKFLRGKFLIIEEKLLYLEKIKKEHALLVECGVAVKV